MTKILALGTVITSIVTTVVALALIAATPVDLVPVGYRIEEMVPFVILQLAFTLVGPLLVLRRPENRIGQLLCATALVSSLLIIMSGIAVRALAAGDVRTGATAAWIASWATLGIGVTFGPALLMFPDGRVRSSAARAALVALVITIALGAAAVAFRPGPLSSFPTVMNRHAWSDQAALLDALLALAMTVGLGATLLGVGSHVVRFRKASGVERQQMKWFLASAFVVAICLVPAITLMYGAVDTGAAPLQRWAGRAIGALSSTAMPLAVGVAILRYRLYDIDLLINRTLVYGSLSAILIATYALGVLVLQSVLRPLTGGSEFAVALSTLLVAAVFQPARGAIQHAVDRRFYRARYDAGRALDAFTSRLRADVDLDSVRADLVGVLDRTVQPSHASVWLRQTDR